MISKDFVITNAQGLHMRPAMTFSQAMSKFKCSVVVKIGDNSYDAKSVMHLMSGAIKFGSTVTVVCDGDDEEKAMEKASELIESGFGE